MAIFDPTILGIVPCKCGRLSNKRHCPFCGAYVKYGLANKTAMHIDPTTGDEVNYSVFRCRSCSKYYDDFQWQFDNCQAPLFISKATKKLNELRGVLTPFENKNVVLLNDGKPLNDNQFKYLTKRALSKSQEQIKTTISINDIDIGPCNHWCDLSKNSNNCCISTCNRQCENCPTKLAMQGLKK